MDRDALRRGFDALQRMPEGRLWRIGMLADAAIRGLAEQISPEALSLQVQIQSAPAIRVATEILRREQCWEITAAAMAKRVCLSPSHFSRLFHRVIGKPFSEYLTQGRIVKAQNLLHHTNLPVGEIATRCGFSRQSYFARRFRELTGMTPTQYRESPDER
jgi:AraC-like DNA-binding protein